MWSKKQEIFKKKKNEKEKKSCYSVKNQPEHSGSTWREKTVRDLQRGREKKKVPFNFQQGSCCVEPGVDCANVFVLPHGKHFSVPVFKKKPKPVIHQRTTCKMNQILSLTSVAGYKFFVCLFVCFFFPQKLISFDRRKEEKKFVKKSLFLVGVFTKL